MTFFKAAVCALTGMILSAGPALAGPTLEFGPEQQGKLQLDYTGQFQLRYRDTGGGPDGTDSVTEFGFRRNRIALMGAWGEHFSLYVQTEFLEFNNVSALSVGSGDASTFQLIDAAMRFKANDQFNVWLGKFKYGFTRENLEACFNPLTLDRSLFIRAPYVVTRDLGVSVWGNLAGGLFQYRLDGMNGRDDATLSPKSSLRYTARAHVSLLDPESGYGYKGTYLGEKKVLTVGAAYQYESGIAFADTVNKTGSVDYKAWTVDAFLEYPVSGIGTFTASGAYVDYDMGDAYKGASPDAGTLGINGAKNGWYAKAGYMLPNLPLQLFGRAEQWTFAQLDGVFDQQVDAYCGGLIYYVRGQDLKVTAEYSALAFDKPGVSASDAKLFVVQLQLIF